MTQGNRVSTHAGVGPHCLAGSLSQPECAAARLQDTIRGINENAEHLERRLNWLEDTFRHCPHAILRFNDDVDEHDERGPVPLGWSMWIKGCVPMHVTAQTFPDLIDACMEWKPEDADE